MLLNEYYFTNTNPGHNKDYRIKVDFARNTVTSIWGPIGGTKAERTLYFDNLAEMEECVRGKRERRLRRGYAEQIEPNAEGIYVIESVVPNEFKADISDMLAAERLAR